eukprot:m.113861 g.113861  ORF g.113861 m.113861 type:complete len:585 (-) comp13529_c0_seq2:2087-3841(-)
MDASSHTRTSLLVDQDNVQQEHSDDATTLWPTSDLTPSVGHGQNASTTDHPDVDDDIDGHGAGGWIGIAADDAADDDNDDHDDDDNTLHESRWRDVPRFVILCIGLTGLTSILLGYDIGIMSGAKLFIKRDMHLTDRQVELMVGILNFVGSFGGLIAGKLSDMVGRKRTVALACAIFILGTALMAFAGQYSVLMAGRIITGIGVGCGLTVAPLYMAELSPKRVRGALVSFNEVAINLGILLGYIGGYAFADLECILQPDHKAWRWMLGVGIIPPLIILLALFIMPESPRWLVQHGQCASALTVLQRTCGEREAKTALAAIQSETSKHSSARVRDLCLDTSVTTRQLLLAGLGIAFFQQASGIEALVYYIPEVLSSAGVADEKQQLLANAGVGFVKVLFILVSVKFADDVGRRKLLFISGIGMAIAFLIMAISFEKGNVLAATLTGMCLYMATFSIGFGPVTWVLVSELFPLQVRGIGIGIATFLNRLMSGTIAMTYLSLENAIGGAGTFYLYGSVAVLSVVFTYFFVPETKGRSLEQIKDTLRGMFSCCGKDPSYKPLLDRNTSRQQQEAEQDSERDAHNTQPL